MPYGKPCPQAPSNTGRITTRVTYARMAALYANGMCMPMPSFRLISACRSAQLPNAPIAHIVIICQSPPSRSGAKPRPYFRSGGAIEICQRFQVGPMAAPQTQSTVPRTIKKMAETPKNPT